MKMLIVFFVLYVSVFSQKVTTKSNFYSPSEKFLVTENEYQIHVKNLSLSYEYEIFLNFKGFNSDFFIKTKLFWQIGSKIKVNTKEYPMSTFLEENSAKLFLNQAVITVEVYLDDIFVKQMELRYTGGYKNTSGNFISQSNLYSWGQEFFPNKSLDEIRKIAKGKTLYFRNLLIKELRFGEVYFLNDFAKKLKKTEKSEKYKSSANNLLDKGNYERAKANYEKVLQIDNNDLEAKAEIAKINKILKENEKIDEERKRAKLAFKIKQDQEKARQIEKEKKEQQILEERRKNLAESLREDLEREKERSKERSETANELLNTFSAAVENGMGFGLSYGFGGGDIPTNHSSIGISLTIPERLFTFGLAYGIEPESHIADYEKYLSFIMEASVQVPIIINIDPEIDMIYTFGFGYSLGFTSFVIHDQEEFDKLPSNEQNDLKRADSKGSFFGVLGWGFNNFELRFQVDGVRGEVAMGFVIHR